MLENLRSFFANLASKNERRRSERGASAVEYGLLIAGIAAVIVVAVMALGPIVKEAFDKTCNGINDTPGTSTTAGPGCV